MQKNRNNKLFDFINERSLLFFKDIHCAICMESIVVSQELKVNKYCGHSFCYYCDAKCQGQCPICRKNQYESITNRFIEEGQIYENDFLCKNCWYPFNRTSRQPILFGSCGHSFCLECVNVFKPNKKNPKIKCKIDNHFSTLDQLNTNYILMELLEKK